MFMKIICMEINKGIYTFPIKKSKYMGRTEENNRRLMHSEYQDDELA